MRVVHSLEDLTSAPSVLTIGTFDGVHLGHQRLIGTVVERARERGVRAVVLTFDPHPRAVLAPQSAPPRITTVDDEAALMATLGVDLLIVYPFTRETANTSAHDFMAMVARAVHPVEVWVGDDFAFGKGREGNLDVLRALGGKFGYTLNVLPRIHLDDRSDGEMIGSTNIRAHLLAGEVAAAARLLGRLYALRGPVVRGAGRGRQIGFPTANVHVPPGIVVPKDGIYATWVTIADDPTRYPAMTYIGPRPQFDNGPRSVEPNLINWDGDLYDRTITVHFAHWLRGDAKFASVDDLIAQMRQDQVATMDALRD
jgi:riboflavin kinase/FMN adenylyltransferase